MESSDLINVNGIEISWDLAGGQCTFGGIPVSMMWIDSTLLGLMSGIQKMVGTERFILALQSEGRNSIEDDWQVINSHSSFADGFKAINNVAQTAGWGSWNLVECNENEKKGIFRLYNSWEGRYQKELGVNWGSAFAGGKLAGYCSKLFGTYCWPTQTAFIAKGDPYDEFIVTPSVTTIEDEINKLLLTNDATRADMAVALKQLKKEVGERQQAEKALEKIAHYDVLTQLPNRTLFIDRFNQAVAHSSRTDNMLAICFLDLDNFKPVNDNHGHEIGDQLLIEVARRIKQTIREEDTVSRQGGDEFALLLRDIESFDQCEQLLHRIRSALIQPYQINDHFHKVSISIGITMYPLDDADLDTLLRHADQAMYQAKLAGKDQHQFFNALNDQKIVQKQTQLQEIKHALVNKEFQLYYQPKVNMKTGQVFGVEALIRWIHPERGLIPPLNFLPVIEGADVEIQIGGWVINEALAQMDSWLQQDINLEVSINISSHHLQSSVFFDQLNEALDRYPDVNSQNLQLEILESSALGDINAISGIIKSCQNVLGIKVALDDFGTGYSSLAHIRNLSANTIKIDQSFVRDLLDDPNDYSIIDGVIGLAKAFDREIIAEGVETEAHGLMLLIMGCNEAQGYGIARPMPAEDIASWIERYIPNQYWMEYSDAKYSIQQHKITLLKLTTEHWFNNVHNEIMTMEDSGFGYYFMKCHLGVWLARFEEEELFDPTWLGELTEAHDDLFSLASGLVKKHQDGNINEARAELDTLNTAYQQVSVILNRP